jgi:DNA-directed RNA polymerase subunit alpha
MPSLLSKNGIDHEYSTIPGVIDDVTNIILNLKKVRFKQVVEGVDNEKVSITVSDTTVFKAGDIGKHLTGFEVLNPDLIICELDPKGSFQIDIAINKGRGYVPAEENRTPNLEIGVIPIDSIFTPIRNVKYTIENYRVEQVTDYEKLVIEIFTDGSIHPKEALKESKNLIQHVSKIKMHETVEENKSEFDEEVLPCAF